MIGVATLPSLTIDCDGVPLPGSLLAALTDVRVQQRLSLPTQCELTFAAPLEALPAALAPGRALRLGTEAAGARLFDGEITALEYSYGPTTGAAIFVSATTYIQTFHSPCLIQCFV